MAAPGTQYEETYTAAKEFIHPIQYADVSFAYSCIDTVGGGVLWRPYRIISRWDDDAETEVQGAVCSNTDQGYGYVTNYVPPRSGRYITRIKVNFDTIDLDIVPDG